MPSNVARIAKRIFGMVSNANEHRLCANGLRSQGASRSSPVEFRDSLAGKMHYGRTIYKYH